MSKTIGFDFQGWPVKIMTWRDVIMGIGGYVENGKLMIDNDSKILDAYPLLLEDDGMGYGVSPEYIVDTDYEIWDKEIMAAEETINEKENKIEREFKAVTIPVVNVFREPVHYKVEGDNDDD